HHLDMVGVVGSNPIAPTSFSPDWSGFSSVIKEYDEFLFFSRCFSLFVKHFVGVVSLVSWV
ncbi:MAG: hypothetical protein VW621_10305, partial [Betaproteobacteria bacterium]